MIKYSLFALLIAVGITTSVIAENKSATPDNSIFKLPELPYAKDALAPHISAETINYHYGKHHQGYVDNLNKLIVENKEFAGKKLEEIIMKTYNDAKHVNIFNNAAQVWNHTFYWNSMKPSGGGQPTSELLEQIIKDFGSYQNFYDQFVEKGMEQFGSGWVWLVWDPKSKKLNIVKTANAETPITSDLIPLITSDVWEHAYYIDYKNKRTDYLKTFLEKLVNWDFATNNFNKVTKS